MSITFEELQSKLSWMTVVEPGWHQHPNGGGWVKNTATVDASAFVAGIVCGDARIYGDAQVYGDALVCGNALVYSNAWEFSPLQVKGSVHFVSTCSHTELQIGCQRHTAIEWKRHFKQIGEANGYTKDQIEEYGLIVNMAAQWLEMKFGGKKEKKMPKRDANGKFVKVGE